MLIEINRILQIINQGKDTSMAGSSFGTLFKITTFGESHGKALGVIVDGCPAGLSLSEHDIQVFLDRRKPGQTKISTPRKENDQVEILSGIFEGKNYWYTYCHDDPQYFPAFLRLW